jgi:HlyD family secretion protein
MMSLIRLLTNVRVLIGAALIGVLLAVALWPTVVTVDTAPLVRGPLVVTIDEEGQTRVRNRFVVSAPVSGRVMRIELEPGDTVKQGMVVARVRAEQAPLLDARARAEAEAAVDVAKASLGQAQAEEQRARAALAQAERELKRARDLAAGDVIPPQQVETREDEAKVAAEAASAAVYAVRAASSELQRAVARLSPTAPDVTGRVVTVTAPVDGVVLRRLRESESVVPAGDALLEIGDPRRLEIVADLLSTDAVRVQPGARAIIEQWGGSQALDAKVRRVEPAGFTKVSALGVEEQRVNVVLDFVDPTDAWTALGDAFRVEVRIVVWEAPDLLKVPTSALFRQGEQWAVYVIEEDRARLTIVEIGQQTGLEAEVKSGLAAGARVIVHPGDTLADGVRVAARTQAD